MSVTSSLTITFSNSTFIEKTELLRAFLRCKWSPINLKDEICFFFQKSDCDMYDWQTTTMTKEDFFSYISQKDSHDMMLGIELYWNNTDIGITCIIIDPQKPVLSLNINRVRVNKEDMWSITDMNWYELHIIQPFIESKRNIIHFVFEDLLC